jgi:hypothetical protein
MVGRRRINSPARAGRAHESLTGSRIARTILRHDRRLAGPIVEAEPMAVNQ